MGCNQPSLLISPVTRHTKIVVVVVLRVLVVPVVIVVKALSVAVVIVVIVTRAVLVIIRLGCNQPSLLISPQPCHSGYKNDQTPGLSFNTTFGLANKTTQYLRGFLYYNSYPV